MLLGENVEGEGAEEAGVDGRGSFDGFREADWGG